MDMETLKKAVKLKRDLDVFSKVYEHFEKALTGKELNVNINIKIYPVIFWSLIFWSKMQVSRTNCILQECFRETAICFCNAEYGKMHKKTEHTLKNHVNVPKLREVH